MAEIFPSFPRIMQSLCTMRPCPSPPTLDWCNWVAGQLQIIQEIRSRVVIVNEELEDEERRHRRVSANLLAKLKDLQANCPHTSKTGVPRPCAESEAYEVCDTCGKQFQI